MRRYLIIPGFILLIASSFFAQALIPDSPVMVIESSWERARQTRKKTEPAPSSAPERMRTSNDRNFSREVLNQLPKGATDPRETTIDARRGALEKVVQDSQDPVPDNSTGYFYIAKMRNDSEKKIDVIFWEYRFIELANPSNVVRRQFLCAANLKPGEKRDLSAFSLLGPSEVISAESLADITQKLFDEKVTVNRIEYSDDSIIQRSDWKYDDVRKPVERATSTSWGKEICRGI